jgi:hypothetical protein
VLYHSGPTFGQDLYSCLDAFVVDASDYSGHLIRHLLNDSEAFHTEWFLRNKSKSGGLSSPDFPTCLITQVTSLDTSSMLLKRFPRSGVFNFGNKSKTGGLSPPDFDFFRRNHSVGNASQALRRCLMR